MKTNLMATETDIIWRIVAWILLALAATYFWFSTPVSQFIAAHNMQMPFGARLGARVGMPVLIGLSLGWALGLLGPRASRSLRVATVLMSLALPLIFMLFAFFMLYIGCGIWNTLAGGYRCGL